MAIRENLTVKQLVTPLGRTIDTTNVAGNQSWGTAAPTTGTALKSDIVWNTNPAAAGNIGWVCTTAGTNGSTSVWKTFGAIAA